MKVIILWAAPAAEAQGQETTWSGIDAVEETPAELKLHTDGDAYPVVVDREYVIAYNRVRTEGTE